MLYILLLSSSPNIHLSLTLTYVSFLCLFLSLHRNCTDPDMIQKCTKVQQQQQQQQQHLHHPFYPTRRLLLLQQRLLVVMMKALHVYTLTTPIIIILWISMTMVFKFASRKSLAKMIGKGLGPRQLGGYVIWGRQRQSITLERVAKDTTPKKKWDHTTHATL